MVKALLFARVASKKISGDWLHIAVKVYLHE
jgi:hypothetical protein